MARIRSLKPEFWGDRKIARVSRDARLLYLSLWNQSDEWSRCHGDTRWVKGHCFPYDDDLDLDAMDRLLTELAREGRIQRYEIDGESLLYLPKLAAHQRLEPQKTPSRLPSPPDPVSDPEKIPERSEKISDSVTERSQTAALVPSPQVEEVSENFPDKSGKILDESGRIVVQQVAGSRGQVAGSMLQGAGGKTADKSAPRPRGHRIPDDFAITEPMRTWAAKTVPGVDINRSTLKFVNHYQAISGARSIMIDWVKCWRNWLLSDYDAKRNQTNGYRQSTSEQRAGQAMALAEEYAAQESATEQLEIEA